MTNGLLQDLRGALRQFWKALGFSGTAIVSLMLGIGATTAIFTVVYGVLLSPYPYKDADRMVHVELRDKSSAQQAPLLTVNGAEYQELRSTATMLGIGIMAGLGLAIALSHSVASVAGGNPRDPLTLLGAAVFMVLVAAVACIVPAWRAATMDPMVALRYK